MNLKQSFSQRTNDTQLSEHNTLHATNDSQRTTNIDRLTRTCLILLTLFFFQSTSIAQETTNEIPSWCTCITFEYACTGMPATELIGATVSISCGRNSYNYIITAGMEGQAQLCITDGIFDCFGTAKESPFLCISEGNWEVCDINGCTVIVDQTLTVEPHINGTLLGYGEYMVPGQSGGIIACEGRNYTGALNTINGPTDLLVCPGDQLFLELEDLIVPSASGMCLRVWLTDTNGNAISGASASYNSTSIANEQVDITNIFSGLETDELYIIHMRLQCCSGDDGDCFNSNVYRYAYINLGGKFDYRPFSSAGFDDPVFTFVPSSTPPGSVIPPFEPVPGLPGFFWNQITFIGYDVVNPDGVDVTYVWYNTGCTNNDPNDDLELQSGVSPGNNPLLVNPPPLFTMDPLACFCVRLDLTYDDGCSEDPVTDSYYYRSDASCFTGPNDDPPSDFLIGNSGSNQNNFDIRVKVNPVKDRQLVFEWSGEMSNESGPLDLTIQNAAGALVMTQKVQANGQQLSVSFDAAPGLYFYTVLVDGQAYSGKFVKK